MQISCFLRKFKLTFQKLIFCLIIIISFWIRCYPRRRSRPDFVWSLSLPRLDISFDHMHPLLPVHFSSFHTLLAFSTFASIFVFLYYCALQISKPSLSNFHLLSSKHDALSQSWQNGNTEVRGKLNSTILKTGRRRKFKFGEIAF